MNALSEISTFSDRLRSARIDAKLSQGQLAERVGMTQGQISKLERGERAESNKTAEIAHECGVSAYWLATGKGPRKASTVGLFELLMEDLGENSQMTLNFLQFEISNRSDVLGADKVAKYSKWAEQFGEELKSRRKKK